jgi:hypothetical protein
MGGIGVMWVSVVTLIAPRAEPPDPSRAPGLTHHPTQSPSLIELGEGLGAHQSR